MQRDRRAFLSAALAAPLFVPRRAWGANDRVAYGLIGAGGRGRYLNGNFQKLGAECVAVSEVYEPNMALASHDSPQAKTYLDYHDLLAQSGIDAVVVATPDHQHAPCLFAALDAGKDVYLEKPMSHSLEQSRRMIEAVRKTKQIVQIGMQRRSAESIIKARQLLDSGVLGKSLWSRPCGTGTSPTSWTILRCRASSIGSASSVRRRTANCSPCGFATGVFSGITRAVT